MIHIRFNNESLTLNETHSLADLLIKKQLHEKNFAVALNRNFIARRYHATTYIKEGDVIDIIKPMQGG